ncbi:hypothetical protein A2U01_0008107 [Trifolium medium]|uniref:Uncharacterized protein n=1 Tax=Trifolium medium TaxID=97028 RepID=A0A392MIS0_9FABA|nr:hypothetical protein [Trifolium medium]
MGVRGTCKHFGAQVSNRAKVRGLKEEPLENNGGSFTPWNKNNILEHSYDTVSISSYAFLYLLSSFAVLLVQEACWFAAMALVPMQ